MSTETMPVDTFSGMIQRYAGTGPILGRNHLMAVAAVRYCLGRQTYIVGECTDWLVQIWPHLIESAREIIRRDVEEAFERDDLQRADGLTYKALGDDCDRERWERVRRLWDAEAR